jgi:valyl-tRNA synthetase
MSKSLGNSIDPLTIIDAYSADALRFSLMMITATGQDVFLSDEKFEIGRNFGTKLWNAARFIRMQMGDEPGADRVARDAALPPVDAGGLAPDDKHILARLDEAVAACRDSLEKRRFNDAAQALYEFLWHQFCDWYVEYSKQALGGDDADRRETVLRVLNHVLERSLRLLHPLMPFLTEELWHAMGYGSDDELIMLAAWPRAAGAPALAQAGIDAASVAYVTRKHELIRAARTLRADYGIAPTRRIDYLVRPHDAEAGARLQDDASAIKLLLRAAGLTVDPELTPGKAMPSAVCELGTVYMPLEGLVDVEAEQARLRGQLEKIDGDLKRLAAKLDNESFVTKAPRHVVDRQVARKRELVEKRGKLTHLIEMLDEAGATQ